MKKVSAPQFVTAVEAPESQNLSLDQDQIFRESLQALEAKLFQAAHVHLDFLHGFLIPQHLTALQAARPTGTFPPRKIPANGESSQSSKLEKAAGGYSKTTMKVLHGFLNRRNECAHPSDYSPDLNETLGYIGELLKRTKQLRP